MPSILFIFILSKNIKEKNYIKLYIPRLNKNNNFVHIYTYVLKFNKMKA